MDLRLENEKAVGVGYHIQDIIHKLVKSVMLLSLTNSFGSIFLHADVVQRYSVV